MSNRINGFRFALPQLGRPFDEAALKRMGLQFADGRQTVIVQPCAAAV